MASEITLTASLSYYKSTVMASAVARALSNVTFNQTGSGYIEGTLSVTTSAIAIPLGGVTAPHWAFFYNLDATNFIRIMNGSGGAKVPKLRAGECAFFPWDDTATPYAQADTSPCLMEYLIIQL